MKLWDDTNFPNLRSSANSISVISVEGEWENESSCRGRRSSLDSIAELPNPLATTCWDAYHKQMLIRVGCMWIRHSPQLVQWKNRFIYVDWNMVYINDCPSIRYFIDTGDSGTSCFITSSVQGGLLTVALRCSHYPHRTHCMCVISTKFCVKVF